MKIQLFALTALCLCLVSSDVQIASADDDTTKDRPARPFLQNRDKAKGQSDQAKSRFGQRQQGRFGQGQKDQAGAGQQGNRNVEQFVAMMLKQFDKDGDQKLDIKELSALMIAMRDRRGQGMADRAGANKRSDGAERRQRPDRNRGAGNGNQDEGGVKPKRPAFDGT